MPAETRADETRGGAISLQGGTTIRTEIEQTMCEEIDTTRAKNGVHQTIAETTKAKARGRTKAWARTKVERKVRIVK